MRARGRASSGVALLAGVALLVSATATAREALAQPSVPSAAAARPRTLGLVEVPHLFGVVQPGEPSVQVVHKPRAIGLRAEASLDAPVVRSAERPAQLEAREHGYELLSAVVYGAREGWYRVRFLDAGEDQLVWLAPAEAGVYRDLQQLVTENPSHLTTEWDRRFYASAQPGSPTHSVRSMRPEIDVEVVRSSSVDGEIWFLLLALEPGPCTGQPEIERVVGAGWVPGHAANGEPNLWFYSRGC